MKRIYISGAISSEPNYKEIFAEAAARIRAAGHACLSPAELNGPIELSWSDYLKRDLNLISGNHVDAIALLPNWSQSPGARLELAVSIALGLEVIDAVTLETVPDPNGAFLFDDSLPHTPSKWTRPDYYPMKRC